MNRRRALVVGNADFEDAENFKRLRTPARDAQAIAAALHEFGDFDVVDVLIDQGENTIEAALEDFYAQAERGDLTLLYYSGHGFRSSDGKLYLVARDTQRGRPLSTAISESYLQDAMRSSHSRHNIVILDCCFSGAFISGHKSGAEPTLLDILSGEATAILASSSRIQYSFEESVDHSLFTEHLLTGLRTGEADMDGDGRITVQELFTYVDIRVRNQRPEQTPMLRLDQRVSELVIARGVETNLGTVYLGVTVPEDIFFKSWLMAKLHLNGYNVTQSIDSSNGTELPMARMQELSRKAAKYLLVVSHNALQCPQVLDELVEVSKIRNRGNFVIPITVDNLTSKQLPEGLEQLDPVDFSQNWAHGLKRLIDRLERDGVSNTAKPIPDGIIELWRKSLAIPDSFRLERPERYLSNWFNLTLPRYIYVHTLGTSESIFLDALPYPTVRDHEYLLSFASEEAFEGHLSLLETAKVDVNTFLKVWEFRHPNGGAIKATNQKLIALLNKTLNLYLVSNGLKPYHFSGSEAFYFALAKGDNPLKLRVDMKTYGRRFVRLTGRFKEDDWHFAIEGQAFLYPYPAYFLRSHVVFTKNGKPLAKTRQQKLRRQIGKRWYNKKWRDLILGAMLWLSEYNDTLTISLGSEGSLLVNRQPVTFNSPVGYLEPVKGPTDA